jgi:hypothetical protein
MKLRYIALILTAGAVIGLIAFTASPLVVAKGNTQGSNSLYGDYEFAIYLEVSFNGQGIHMMNGTSDITGDYIINNQTISLPDFDIIKQVDNKSIIFRGYGNKTLGTYDVNMSFIDSGTIIEPFNWENDYPSAVPILTILGLSLAIMGSIMYFFDINRLLTIISLGVILLGGLIGLIGILLVVSWTNWFIDFMDNSVLIENVYYHFGFIMTVTFTALTVLGTITIFVLELLPDKKTFSYFKRARIKKI